MSFFSKLFGGTSIAEQQLQELYVPMLQAMWGIPEREAKKTFSEVLERAKSKLDKKLPQNLGDVLLERELTDANVKLMLEKRRVEGIIKNDDIRWWRNMSDLERQFMLEFDEVIIFAMFTKHRESGLNADVANQKVRKSFPFYGEPDDKRYANGNDRPLPCELKNRVNNYIRNLTNADGSLFQAELETYSSCNAMIRKEIIRGNL